MADYADHSSGAPMRHRDELAHRIVVGEIHMGKNAVDDNHGLGGRVVGRGEEAALKQRNVHHLKILRACLKIERMWRVLHRSGLLSTHPEWSPIVVFTEGNDMGKIRRLYAGNLAYAVEQLPRSGSCS